jgi:hypothetical protein
MPRKADRAIYAPLHRDTRMVASIEPIPSVPTNCIQVEGGHYCVGHQLIPTHNSSIITFGLTVRDVLCNPEITVGIFSHTRPIAKGFLKQIKRELEDNEWLKHLYPEILWPDPARQSPKWSEDGGLIVRRQGNPKEATIEAYGLVDGQPTGAHFKLRVYDDVVPEIMSPEMVKKTTDAWDMSQNLGSDAGVVRYIGTRYQLNDTYSTIMERKAAEPRIFPATHNGRFDGQPVFWSDERWADKLRTSSRQIIAAQQLQNPMADDEATFRTEWLKAYEVRPRTLNVYIMGDPSAGRHATSDNTAIAVVGIASNGAKFLLDGVCHRMTLSQRWLALRGLYHRWSKMRGVQHIAVGWERFGMQADEEYFREQMDLEQRRKIPNAYFPILELSWPREGGNSKQERVQRLEPDFRNGRFFLPGPVLHEGKAKVWRVITDSESRDQGSIVYDDWRGDSRVMKEALEGGSEDLIARALITRDPTLPSPRAGGGRYDVTCRFLEEYRMFPFGLHDDLLDACSRLYDMDAMAPAPPSRTREVVRVYADGV